MITILYTNKNHNVNSKSIKKDDSGNYTILIPEASFIFSILQDGKQLNSKDLTPLEQYFCLNDSQPFNIEKKDFIKSGQKRVLNINSLVTPNISHSQTTEPTKKMSNYQQIIIDVNKFNEQDEPLINFNLQNINNIIDLHVPKGLDFNYLMFNFITDNLSDLEKRAYKLDLRFFTQEKKFDIEILQDNNYLSEHNINRISGLSPSFPYYPENFNPDYEYMFKVQFNALQSLRDDSPNMLSFEHKYLGYSGQY